MSFTVPVPRDVLLSSFDTAKVPAVTVAPPVNVLAR